MLTYYCFALDFGYEWPWRIGHLVPLVVFALLAGLAVARGWRRWIQIAAAGLALWSLVGLLIVQYVVRIDSPIPLPAERFLEAGTGTAVDLGCGSGRSTLMLALARPGMKVVALDKFATGYGIGENTPARLRANLESAGVAGRVEIREGDMRALPFADASLDGAVSAYAMDHLGRTGFRTAVAETARVLKPGGEFLFLTVQRDLYVKIAYPFFHHGYYGPSTARARWRAALTAGVPFEVTEEGTAPGMLYFVCRKRGPEKAQ